jgi:hypothetical protein
MATVSSRIGERDGTTLYSMRVGTAQLLDDGTTRISAHMSIYDVEDAVALLSELAEKYRKERDDERARKKLGISGRYRASSRKAD